MSVAHFPERLQPLMPMTPQDRVRRQVSGQVIPLIAERIYQADKGSLRATLSDLRSEDARAVYLAEALQLLEPEARFERLRRVNAADAQVHARREDEHETLMRQARADIARYGAGSQEPMHFGAIRPGHCWVCRQRIPQGAVATLYLAEQLIADVHAGCAMQDDRLQPVSSISFVLKGGGR